ncbi:hypothetical protein EB796_009913 [Bugula neritina]|uniref:Uncharacterized protein n=1 Tax=Bugula neritina TaxID=10212 RepID=A0A7J7K2E8_BUGNE|nr:hypothetical protein EB796_009913 [Bugula neritina]
MKDSRRWEQMAARLVEQRQLTVTLLLIVVFFIVSVIPTVSFWLMKRAGFFAKHKISLYAETIFWSVSGAFVAINYVGNFFIYILANRAFRNDFSRVLLRMKSSWGSFLVRSSFKAMSTSQQTYQTRV